MGDRGVPRNGEACGPLRARPINRRPHLLADLLELSPRYDGQFVALEQEIVMKNGIR